MRKLLTGAAVAVVACCLIVGGLLVWNGSHGSVDKTPAPLPKHLFAMSPRHAVTLAKKHAGAGVPGSEGTRAQGAGGGRSNSGGTTSDPGSGRHPAARVQPVSLTGMSNAIAIPATGIRAPLLPEQIRAAAMRLPNNPKIIGWLTSSAAVDSVSGTTLVAGHVSWDGVSGALWHLADVKPGDVIVTADAQGHLRRWAVYKTAVNLRTDLPSGIFAQQGRRRLIIVTCAGIVWYQDGHYHYRDNLRVYATPLT
ncbi:MAG: class F sortase [Sciscionella sp.]